MKKSKYFREQKKIFIFNYYVQRDLRAFMKTETVRGGKIEFLDIKNRIAKHKKNQQQEWKKASHGNLVEYKAIL